MSSHTEVSQNADLNEYLLTDLTRPNSPRDRNNTYKDYYREDLNDEWGRKPWKRFFRSLLDHIEIHNSWLYSSFCATPNVSY